MAGNRKKSQTGGREATTGFISGDYSLAVGMPSTPPPDGWRWTQLTELARLESGHTPSRKFPEYWDGGDVCWIGIRDATAAHGQTIYDTNQHTTELGILNSSARVLPKNTVCLSRTASVGYVIVMGEEMATSQDFVNWVCSDDLDYQFLKYILLSENRSFARFSRGTTHQTIYYPEVKAFHICHPPLPEQKAIAHILGSLDDKIELNRQMNATLEGMAQALFKSWFVDFDPVIDNALAAGNPIPDALAARAQIRGQLLADGRANREAAKPFPATFHFTEELGWIPEGWEVRSIGTIAKAAGGYAFKSKVFRESGYPVVKIKNIVGNGTVSLSDTQCIGIEDAHMAEKFSLEDGNLLMAMTGATVGKIGLVVNENQPAYLNQRVAKLEGRNIENLSPFLFCFFREQSNFAQIVGLASGSAQPNISASGIESIPCAIPDNDQHTVFTGLVEPHFEKWISNHRLFVNLANLRDTLLPKLISGELRIPDAEKLVAEAL